MEYRIEKDMLGEKQVPKEAYWGIHTQRALENFRVSSSVVDSELIRGLAVVKKACCLANADLGLLDKEKAAAITRACDEILEGRFEAEFPLDALQGGAGTSTNMNVNEVIANRAIEILGGKKGGYAMVDPIEDVNLNQSTNDVYPTALKVAGIRRLRMLAGAVERLQGCLQKKEKEFAAIVTIGRTELKDAVPMTLGQEFSAFAEAIGRDRWRVFKCEERLRQVNLGGTAVGTGLTAPRSYIFQACDKLRDLTGFGISRGENLVDQTANADAFVEVSGILTAHSQNIVKICGDLRLLSLLEEIQLPAVQAGSSVMPGKVNPVVLESAIQAGLKCIADNSLVTECASRGSLQINEFLPLLGHALLGQMEMLEKTDSMLEKHVAAITADREGCKRHFERSPMIITALLPSIGYKKALGLLQGFVSSGEENLRGFLAAKLGAELVDKAFSPDNLTALGYKPALLPSDPASPGK